ncbi:MAG: hypothetical protein KDD36_07290 [Flavobacteriales bacterium]|nr:hypothetical protein [Flavobacteriales bacterium]
MNSKALTLALMLFAFGGTTAWAQTDATPQPDKTTPTDKDKNGDLIIREEGTPSSIQGKESNQPKAEAKQTEQKAEAEAKPTPEADPKKKKSSLGKARKNAAKKIEQAEPSGGEVMPEEKSSKP